MESDDAGVRLNIGGARGPDPEDDSSFRRRFGRRGCEDACRSAVQEPPEAHMAPRSTRCFTEKRGPISMQAVFRVPQGDEETTRVVQNLCLHCCASLCYHQVSISFLGPKTSPMEEAASMAISPMRGKRTRPRCASTLCAQMVSEGGQNGTPSRFDAEVVPSLVHSRLVLRTTRGATVSPSHVRTQGSAFSHIPSSSPRLQLRLWAPEPARRIGAPPKSASCGRCWTMSHVAGSGGVADRRTLEASVARLDETTSSASLCDCNSCSTRAFADRGGNRLHASSTCKWVRRSYGVGTFHTYKFG